MPKDSPTRDAEREALRRAVVRRLWLLGYDAGDIVARVLDSRDYKHLLKGYAHPVAAVRLDCDAIQTEYEVKYPGMSWEQLQYLERCRMIYQQGVLMAETMGPAQARANALKVALEANDAIGRVQLLPVDGVGKVKPKTDDKDKEEKDDSLPGFHVTPPKGAVTERPAGEKELPSTEPRKKKKRRRL